MRASHGWGRCGAFRWFWDRCGIMPPQPVSWGAIPVLLYGQLSGLRTRHEVTIVTLAGPDPAELEAVERLRRSGLEVHPVVRSRAVLGWLRRGAMAAAWLRGTVP